MLRDVSFESLGIGLPYRKHRGIGGTWHGGVVFGFILRSFNIVAALTPVCSFRNVQLQHSREGVLHLREHNGCRQNTSQVYVGRWEQACVPYTSKPAFTRAMASLFHSTALI